MAGGDVFADLFLDGGEHPAIGVVVRLDQLVGHMPGTTSRPRSSRSTRSAWRSIHTPAVGGGTATDRSTPLDVVRHGACPGFERSFSPSVLRSVSAFWSVATADRTQSARGGAVARRMAPSAPSVGQPGAQHGESAHRPG